MPLLLLMLILTVAARAVIAAIAFTFHHAQVCETALNVSDIVDLIVTPSTPPCVTEDPKTVTEMANDNERLQITKSIERKQRKRLRNIYRNHRLIDLDYLTYSSTWQSYWLMRYKELTSTNFMKDTVAACLQLSIIPTKEVSKSIRR